MEVIKNQMKISELKNTVTEILKTEWIGSVAEWREQRKKSMNWKIKQQKLTNLNNRENRL